MVSIGGHAMITHNNKQRAIESFVCRDHGSCSFYICIGFLKFARHGWAVNTVGMSRVVDPEKVTNKNIPLTWLVKSGHQVFSNVIINSVEIIDVVRWMRIPPCGKMCWMK